MLENLDRGSKSKRTWILCPFSLSNHLNCSNSSINLFCLKKIPSLLLSPQAFMLQTQNEKKKKTKHWLGCAFLSFYPLDHALIFPTCSTFSLQTRVLTSLFFFLIFLHLMVNIYVSPFQSRPFNIF